MPTTTSRPRAAGGWRRALLLAVAGWLAAAPVGAATLKVATVLPEGSGWMREMRAAAAAVAERTEGRVKLKFYPGGVMGNAKTVLRKMRAGQLHGGAFNSGALTGLYRETELYSLPLLFETYAEVDAVRERLDPEIKRGLAGEGFAALALSETGFAHLLSQRAIRSVDDLRSAKLWVLEDDPTSQIALRFAEVSAVPLPLADVYTGLQTGLVDSVAAPPAAAIAFQWHTKVRYLTDVPLMYLIGVLAFDEGALARLDPGDRALLESVMAQTARRLDVATRASHDEARRALESQGVETVPVGPEEMVRWRAIADQTIAALRAEGAYAPELLDAMLARIAETRAARAGR